MPKTPYVNPRLETFMRPADSPSYARRGMRRGVEIKMHYSPHIYPDPDGTWTASKGETFFPWFSRPDTSKLMDLSVISSCALAEGTIHGLRPGDYLINLPGYYHDGHDPGHRYTTLRAIQLEEIRHYRYHKNIDHYASTNHPGHAGGLHDVVYAQKAKKWPNTARAHSEFVEFATFLEERDHYPPMRRETFAALSVLFGNLIDLHQYSPESLARYIHPTGFFSMDHRDKASVAIIDILWNYMHCVEVELYWNLNKYYTPHPMSWSYFLGDPESRFMHKRYVAQMIDVCGSTDLTQRLVEGLGIASREIGFGQLEVDGDRIRASRTELVRKSYYAHAARTLMLLELKLKGDPRVAEVEITKESCGELDNYAQILKDLGVTRLYPAEEALIAAMQQFKHHGGLAKYLESNGYPVEEGIRNVVGPYNTGYSLERDLTFKHADPLVHETIPFVRREIERRKFDTQTGNSPFIKT